MPAPYDAPKDMPEDWLACKGQRVHWLRPIAHPAGTPRPGGTIPVFWQCDRCTAERHDWHDPTTLAVIPSMRRYYYPDGYSDAGAGDVGRPTPLTWKATYLRAVGAISAKEAAANRRYRKELWQAEGEDV